MQTNQNKTRMPNLKIYSQNCSWWPVLNRKQYFQKISNLIIEKQPDVVFLQEVFYKKWLICFDIEGYHTISQINRIFNHAGLVILVKKNLSFKLKKAGRFKKQYGIKAKQFFCSLIAKRGFLHIYLPELELHLINAHLTAGFTTYYRYDPVRFKQAFQLFQYAKIYHPVIFGGDLNFHQDSPGHNMFNSEFLDISQGAGNTFPIDNCKYDYLFSGGLKILENNSYSIPWFEQNEAKTKQPIDHYGIFSEINWG